MAQYDHLDSKYKNERTRYAPLEIRLENGLNKSKVHNHFLFFLSFEPLLRKKEPKPKRFAVPLEM